MDLKTVCVIFVALALVSVEAFTLDVTNTDPNSLTDVSSDTTGTASLRSKRQFGYPGGGFGSSTATASAIASGGGYGGYGGGISNAAAFANAGSSGGGYGLYGKK